MKLIFVAIVLCFFSSVALAADIRIGSKAFTEGYLLGELAAQTIEETGSDVKREFGLGSTAIVLEALLTNEIDIYPEYTGTIAEAVFHDLSLRNPEELQRRLKQKNLLISQPLGFENTYALAVRREFAEAHQLKTISDLKRIAPQIRAAFSHEFMSRNDGLKGVERAYGFTLPNARAIEHNLSFRTIAENKADLIAAYSTDDKIELLDLVLLEDNKNVFPPYQAVFLVKEEFSAKHPEAWAALNSLAGSVDEELMRKLNGQVERDHLDVSTVVGKYLGKNDEPQIVNRTWLRIQRRTQEHFTLVGIALLISVAIGIPIGILSSRYYLLGQGFLILSAIVQTIPSLALLSLLIPLFGIGQTPALIALCLYSLLPVMLNTSIGLQSIDKNLLETARAIGLTPSKTLFLIELPLASRSILGGIRTATIIGIGTATLAALIGAGGYGVPIISGLATNDTNLILVGAIPCAIMALLTYVAFDLVGWLLSLRKKRKSRL